MRILIYIVSIVILSLAKDLPSQAQSAKIESLQNLLQTNIADTTSVNTLNALGWALMYQNPDTSIALGKQALDLATKIDNQRAIAKSNSNLGVYFWLKGDYLLSLSHHFKALELHKSRNDKKGVSSSLGNIGVVCWHQGDYPKALEYYFKAMAIFKEMGDTSKVAVALGNIGLVYQSQGNYNEALVYSFKSLKIKEKRGNKGGITTTLGNIGGIYDIRGNYLKALEYYLKALKIMKELGNKSGIATTYGNIGGIYYNQGNLSRQQCNCTDDGGNYSYALKYYFKALEIRKDLGSKKLIASTLGNIGLLYTTTGKFEQAEQHLMYSLALADSIGALNMTMQVEEMLADLYDTTGRYRLAYEHYKQYSAAKDSLFNEEKSKSIGKLEAKHEFEMAEMERKRLEIEELRLQNEKIKRRNLLQYSVIVIVIVMVFIFIFASGRFNIPIRLLEGITFLAFLLFFEFMLVLLDPYLEQYSSGAPAIKLGFNALLAGLIFPLHSFFENKLKRNIANPK